MITGLMDRFGELGTTWLWMVFLAAWRTLPILILATGIGLVLRGIMGTQHFVEAVHVSLWDHCLQGVDFCG